MRCEGAGPLHRVPQRTCIACRRVRAKSELVRLAAGADGRVVLDLEHRSPGRGAYLCEARECWLQGLKGDKLSHFLRRGVSSENKEELRVLAEKLLSRVAGQNRERSELPEARMRSISGDRKG